MTETTFHYNNQRVNHRIGSGVFVSAIGFAIALFYPDAPWFFRALLLVAVVVVIFHVVQFRRLRTQEGPALTLSDDGLDVTAWGLGAVPWSEIDGAHLAARNGIRVEFKDPREWKQKMTPLDRAFGLLEVVFGSGMFTIDAGILRVRPDAVLTEIKAHLAERA